MKISFILMFAIILQASASVYSQNTKLDISVTDMKVKDVLRLIESKSNFRFFYNDELSDLDKTVTVSSADANIDFILNQVFATSEITYRIFENNVIVIAPALSLQQQQVTGAVTDATTGEPLIGVSIVIEGTTKGTVTDINGKFTIDAQNTDNLVFSFVGYMIEKVNVGTQTVINIKLVPDIRTLDEVVVIGYGTVKKRDLTGSVSSIKSEDIIKAPTSNAVEAIQGKVTGVDVIRSSGKAGSGVNIRIRGSRSFADPTGDDPAKAFDDLNKPLFIIDGIQGGNFADLNPNDIESIEILKDASTTAIYGWQGASGVVIITTKKAKAGKTKVSYSGYYGVNGLTPYPEGRLGEDYLNLRREAYRSQGDWNSPADDRTSAFQDQTEWDAIQNGQWINWVDLLLNNSTLQSHQISVSNGSEKGTSYFSAGYYNEIGPVKDNYKRYNARFNGESNFTKWLKTGLSAQITYIDNDVKVDALSKANSMSPLGTVYLPDGAINIHPIANDNTILNPLTDARENAAIDNSVSSRILSQGFVELMPVKGLSIKTVLGVNINFNRRGVFNDSLSMAQTNDQRNEASISTSSSRSINWDNIITYTKAIGEHSFTITGINSYTNDVTDNLYAEGYRQPLTSYLYYNLNATNRTDRVTTSGYTESTTLSYAGRLNYSFKGRYLVTLTDRFDGSSRLSEGNKWSSFPSLAVAWRVSDELFMKDFSFLDNFKLRFSYGEAGNANIPAYGTISGIVPNSRSQSFGDTFVPTYYFTRTKANANVTWERSATFNYGIDLGFLNNRIDLTTEIYSTRTTGILLARPLPLSAGADVENQFIIWQNIGESENKGLEISLNTTNIKTRDFTWTTNISFSSNKEKIVKLINDDEIIGTNPEDFSIGVGQSLGVFYNYKKTGIWQIADSAEMNNLFPQLAPGDIKLADLDGNDTIDSRDRTFIGQKNPKWLCGLTNTFTYKGFDLSILVYARWGHMIKNELLGRYNPNGLGNGPAYFEYWTPENPTNDFPRPRNQRMIDYVGYQTLPYVDGSFIKIKNITLGYTLPARISKKIFIENLRVYVTASNLFTFAKSHLVKYYDPENSGSEQLPMSKQFVFGANIDL